MVAAQPILAAGDRMPHPPNAAPARWNIPQLNQLYERWLAFLQGNEGTFREFHESACESLVAIDYDNAIFDEELFPSLIDAIPLAGNIQLDGLPDTWNSIDDMRRAANTPLEKLLVAFLWKQSDLKKFRRLLDGIRRREAPIGEDLDRVVMDQFGRHLREPLAEPIFDQHTARHMRAVEHLGNPGSSLETFIGPKEHLLGKEAMRTDYKRWWSEVVEPAVSRRNGVESRATAMVWADRTMYSLGKALAPKLKRAARS
jgi:hypothetical protein